MTEKYYCPLSDMSRIKASLMSLFFNNTDITRLIMPTPDNESFTLEQNWYGGKFEKNMSGEAEIITLSGHCFDTPYIEGAMAADSCAIFIETYLTKMENQHIKEVGLDISVICHKDLIRLSTDDSEYYHAKGIYGNRVDSSIQIIHSSLLDSPMTDDIRKKYSIGNISLSLEKNPLKQYCQGKDFYGKCLSYTYQAFYRHKK